MSGGVDSVVMLDMAAACVCNLSDFSHVNSRNETKVLSSEKLKTFLHSSNVSLSASLECLTSDRLKTSQNPTNRSFSACLECEKLSDLIIAHFNHGIREDSDEDEEFVRGLAERYGVEFVSRKEELGAGASEELARERRYRFLWEVAGEDGEIWTGHHADDLVETVAINLIRGTGWRGLVPLDSPGVVRPMLGVWKEEILEYAMRNGLEWREDSTNSSQDYLRNRVRKRLRSSSRHSRPPGRGMEFVQSSLLAKSQSNESGLCRDKIFALYENQLKLKREIDEIVGLIVEGEDVVQRESYRGMDDDVAVEILRGWLEVNSVRAMREQILRFLDAIRNYENGKKFNLPGDVLVKLGRDVIELEG